MEQWLSATRDFGFDHLTVMTAPTSHDTRLAPLIIEGTLPESYLREFDADGMLKHCIVVEELAKSIMPQTWTLERGVEGSNEPFTDEMKSLLRRHKLSMGVVIPVFALDAGRYVIRYDGNRPPLSCTEIGHLSMASMQAFDVFDRLRRSGTNQNVLSARELEVVRWTAQGKTSLEIGQILSLSDHTVNAYMTNAIKKLDCVNRTQLVAKALRMKLIS
ncbi:helix-turn-helix transcriptional regulator [Peteryoungia desertarenae]|nr:LuxR family transcriptional regulator [Peteryoungia desertarenae]